MAAEPRVVLPAGARGSVGGAARFLWLDLNEVFERRFPAAAGPEPYDALNSPVIRAVTRPSRRLRILATQLLRYAPVDLRRLVGVAWHVNPKTVSLVARAHTEMAGKAATGSERDEHRQKAETYLQWLWENRTIGFSGAAWGYSFPWQSTRIRLARGQPSTVCTVFCAQGFLDAYIAWGIPQYLDVARSAANFIVADCPRLESERGVAISYAPNAPVYVHNANLLAGALIAQVQAATPQADPRLTSLVCGVVDLTLAEQRGDGAWYYDCGAAPGSMVDGFHTGFVLESLERLGRASGIDCGASIRAGLDYYLRRLIAPCGRPRRAAGHGRITDIRDCAQALITLDRFRSHPQAAERIGAVLDWTVANMRSDWGHYFWQSKLPIVGTSRVAYPRAQAWMLLALARLCARAAPDKRADERAGDRA